MEALAEADPDDMEDQTYRCFRFDLCDDCRARYFPSLWDRLRMPSDLPCDTTTHGEPRALERSSFCMASRFIRGALFPQSRASPPMKGDATQKRETLQPAAGGPSCRER